MRPSSFVGDHIWCKHLPCEVCVCLWLVSIRAKLGASLSTPLKGTKRFVVSESIHFLSLCIGLNKLFVTNCEVMVSLNYEHV